MPFIDIDKEDFVSKKLPFSKNSLRKVAHDLRGPVSVLQGYHDFRKNTLQDGDEREFWHAARASLVRIQKVIEELESLVIPRNDFSEDKEEIPSASQEGQPKVLLVENDETLRLQWRDVLHEKDFALIEIKNGEELLKKNLDYKMIQTAIVNYEYEGSALNGFDVVEFLKRKGVPKIHLCIGEERELSVEGSVRDLGIESIIRRPVGHIF